MAKKAAKSDEAARKALESTPAEPTVTKAEAIRRAIAAGHDQTAAGIAYIQSEFGLDVSSAHFAASKSSMKSKNAITKVVTKRPAQISAPKSDKGEADLLSAMEAIKPLVASMGADKLKRLVDLLG